MPSASFSVAMASSFISQRKLFSSVGTRSISILGRLERKLALHLVLGLLQLAEELRADREQVATGQLQNLRRYCGSSRP